MNKREQTVVNMVWKYYHDHGRHDLPWRQTISPYKILVSEMMLQQTQVERVVPKYRAFLRAYPSVRRLAAAPLGDVLKRWQGLGYNRRAKYLREAAIIVTDESSGRFPREISDLKHMPGVGPYTAGAIMVFAFNQPALLIETNIRQVFLHHFFADADDVSDSDVLKLVARTLPHDNPRAWYWALMDYGAHLKREYGNSNQRSRHYVRQSTFQGSDRQIRGAIIKLFAGVGHSLSAPEVQGILLEHDAGRVAKQLAQLTSEGLLSEDEKGYALS